MMDTMEAFDTQPVLLERDGMIAIVTLNNPKNATR